MEFKDRLMQYGDVECNESLKKHTTFRIGGKAKYYVYPRNELGLLRIIELAKEMGLPFKLFGKGSNILAGDNDYEGIVIGLDRYFNDFSFEEDGTCVVQAGTSIILLAQEAMKHGFTGLEFASGIPGTLGGAIYMNAGAYKSDISSIMKEVYVMEEDGTCEWKSVDTLDFAYRHSIFQSHPNWIILGARLKLELGDQEEIRALMDSRRQRRLESQPLNFPCAGSIFRNPTNQFAWQLIEELGLRGKQIGGAKVSEKHANFIVNANEAKAEDVVSLIQLIQKEAKDTYGIDLIPEVEWFNL